MVENHYELANCSFGFRPMIPFSIWLLLVVRALSLFISSSVLWLMFGPKSRPLNAKKSLILFT